MLAKKGERHRACSIFLDNLGSTLGSPTDDTLYILGNYDLEGVPEVRCSMCKTEKSKRWELIELGWICGWCDYNLRSEPYSRYIRGGIK